MSKHIFILGASAIIATAFAFGCGSSDDASSTAATSSTGGNTTTSSTTTSSKTSSTTATGMGGATSSTTGTAGGGGSATTLSCTAYCTTVMANCTSAADAQYSTMDSCMGVCSAFAVGTTADTTGDTLGCRTYHAGAAAGSQANADLHCQHAGPLGGGASFCGSDDPCNQFCEIAIHACTGANQQFNGDLATCKTACSDFTMNSTPYNDGDTAANDLYCRMYHLSVAADGNAADATTHCPHIVTDSAVCK